MFAWMNRRLSGIYYGWKMVAIGSAVRIVAGFFIMTSLVLAHVTGQVDMTKLSWLWFTAFVGANLFQSGFTKFCPLDMILKKAKGFDSGKVRQEDLASAAGATE